MPKAMTPKTDHFRAWLEDSGRKMWWSVLFFELSYFIPLLLSIKADMYTFKYLISQQQGLFNGEIQTKLFISEFICVQGCLFNLWNAFWNGTHRTLVRLKLAF